MGHWSWGCFSLISCYLELTSLLTMPPPLTLSTLPTLLPHALWIHVILFFLTSLSQSLLFPFAPFPLNGLNATEML